MGILRKLAESLKKVLFLHFMTTFYNFALKKIEPKSWLNSIWKLKIPTMLVFMYLWYVCIVCMCVWFVYSRIKNSKNNNSKSAQFAQRN